MKAVPSFKDFIEKDGTAFISFIAYTPCKLAYGNYITVTMGIKRKTTGQTT